MHAVSPNTYMCFATGSESTIKFCYTYSAKHYYMKLRHIKGSKSVAQEGDKYTIENKEGEKFTLTLNEQVFQNATDDGFFITEISQEELSKIGIGVKRIYLTRNKSTEVFELLPFSKKQASKEATKIQKRAPKIEKELERQRISEEKARVKAERREEKQRIIEERKQAREQAEKEKEEAIAKKKAEKQAIIDARNAEKQAAIDARRAEKRAKAEEEQAERQKIAVANKVIADKKKAEKTAARKEKLDKVKKAIDDKRKQMKDNREKRREVNNEQTGEVKYKSWRD